MRAALEVYHSTLAYARLVAIADRCRAWLLFACELRALNVLFRVNLASATQMEALSQAVFRFSNFPSSVPFHGSPLPRA